VWASFGTFAYAKDQASLPLDGLLKENPTPCSHEIFRIDNAPDTRLIEYFPKQTKLNVQRL
jgi:hypothetical protein